MHFEFLIISDTKPTKDPHILHNEVVKYIEQIN